MVGLDIYLDVNGETPLYQQIRNQVVVGIAEGKLLEGESLPSTRQLAADFGINFHTVNKAYDLLRQEGLVRINRKSGATVYLETPDPQFAQTWQSEARVWLAEAWLRGLSSEEVLDSCRDIMEDFSKRGCDALSHDEGSSEGGNTRG